MPITEAIILAGGSGTRLRSVISGLPKCMAPVGGKPFLHWVISYFQKQGIETFIFSLGYKHEIMEEYLHKKLPGVHYQLSIENAPLGTGGAVKLACQKATTQDVAVINGDTLFKVQLQLLSTFHQEHHAECTLCLKPMQNVDRYGTVELNENREIRNFSEKKFHQNGLINGGVYALKVKNFLDKHLPEKFSFEKEYLEKYYSTGKLMGLIQDEYFIDIGVPIDFERAQLELNNMA
ncbi:MAG TPA: nucleotidyltransferase family protein [Puia sp.]|nr:nucleotidyltransferase family protein [Puia sp.]